MKGGRFIRRGAAVAANARGFSLIEILVSFTLLALFIATAFQVYSIGMRSTALASDYARAQTLARSKLATLAALPTLLPGEESGRLAIGRDARMFRWQISLMDYALLAVEESGPGSLTRPLLAIVEVTWDGENEATAPHRFQLRALLLGNRS